MTSGVQYQRPFAFRTTWGAVYTGSRKALLVAGVMRDGEFPGDPGRPVCAYRLGDGRRIFRPKRRADRFTVYVDKAMLPELARADSGFQRFMARTTEGRQR